MGHNRDKLNSRVSSGGPSATRQPEVSNSLNEAGAIMSMLDNDNIKKTDLSKTI